MNASELIRLYRIKRNKTMSECAKAIHKSQTGYSEIEHGRSKLSADDFLVLIKYLNIDLNQIFSSDEEEISFKLNKADFELLKKIIKKLDAELN